MGSFGERERKSTVIQLGIKPGTFQILVGNTVITKPLDSWQRSRNLKVCPGGHTPWNPIVLKHAWLGLAKLKSSSPRKVEDSTGRSSH